MSRIYIVHSGTRLSGQGFERMGEGALREGEEEGEEGEIWGWRQGPFKGVM